ncbi:PucR family transcriptional regulator [Lolliginicoccus levis]|uniref:PucR family transcriptional regulator n=1 Tax=Lolliginicoccus levis TaxID=2919542 RepID=UPI00241CA640|nr:helix-turn-helix domain-containing protein [Lolliginicoccus levis]
MPRSSEGRDPGRVTGLDLDPRIVDALQASLPRYAELTVSAVTVEVPSYTRAFRGRMGRNIENAVRMALGALVQIAARPADSDQSSPLPAALDAAYELGRGEARNGRSMDALLAAYRVGARVSWRAIAATAVEGGLPASTVARFAELAFAFIDELSAASSAGHADERATTGRVREHYLDQLGRQLLAGKPQDLLLASAERANWQPPTTLTSVLLPLAQSRGLASRFVQSTLQLTDDLPGIEASDAFAVLLVPDMDGRKRGDLLALLHDRPAIIGPARPWTDVAASYQRALRTLALVPPSPPGPVDTDDHLVELILTADPDATADLRRRALAPLDDLRGTTADRLGETLRAWLLRQGQRDTVAADLFVHPQTVRYRMNQLREIYGDALADPRVVLELILALSAPGGGGTSGVPGAG